MHIAKDIADDMANDIYDTLPTSALFITAYVRHDDITMILRDIATISADLLPPTLSLT
jgi:hypothetical protein